MSDPGALGLDVALLVPAFLHLLRAAIHLSPDQFVWGHVLQTSYSCPLFCVFSYPPCPTPALPRLLAPWKGIAFMLSFHLLIPVALKNRPISALFAIVSVPCVAKANHSSKGMGRGEDLLVPSACAQPSLDIRDSPQPQRPRNTPSLRPAPVQALTRDGTWLNKTCTSDRAPQLRPSLTEPARYLPVPYPSLRTNSGDNTPSP